MGAERNVVVLGGGIGGIVAARQLRKKLTEGIGVVLVDPDDTYTFSPSLLWLMSGERKLAAISRSRARLGRKGIKFLQGQAEGLDPDRRTIRVGGQDISYERLVIALGVQPTPGLMPGLQEGAINIYTAEGALQSGRALADFDGGRVVVAIAKLPYKCPAAPNEAAFLAESLLRRRGVKAEVALYTPEPFPMPTAGERAGRALAEMLSGRGIELHTGQMLQEVDVSSKELVFQSGERTSYDLLLAIPPHRTPSFVASSGLANDAGFISVAAGTLATPADGVFALGDVTQIPIAGGKFLPKAGVFAERQASVVANRIADELAGREPKATFDGHGSCFVEMGDGVAAFATGNFYAESAPSVSLRRPAKRWHLAKVAFEKYWLTRWA